MDTEPAAPARRAIRGTARALLVALAVAGPLAGLSACGSLDGSAHPSVAVPAAVSGAAAPAGPAATAGPAAPAPAAPAAAPAGKAPAAGTSGSGGAGGAGHPATGGSGSGGSGSGGSGGGTTGSGGTSGSGGGSGSSAPAAKVTSLRVTVKPTCPVHAGPGAPFSSPGTDVTIAWTVTGAPGAALAVDQPGLYGAYGSDYPASGTLQLPFGCTPGTTTSHTYTIWPKGVHGVSKTITVSARSDG